MGPTAGLLGPWELQNFLTIAFFFPRCIQVAMVGDWSTGWGKSRLSSNSHHTVSQNSLHLAEYCPLCKISPGVPCHLGLTRYTHTCLKASQTHGLQASRRSEEVNWYLRERLSLTLHPLEISKFHLQPSCDLCYMFIIIKKKKNNTQDQHGKFWKVFKITLNPLLLEKTHFKHLICFLLALSSKIM